jgi:signal transduction histidine kinase
LFTLQSSQFTPFLFPGDWEEGKVRALLAARDGGMWVGTVRGLKRIDHERHIKLSEADGLSHGEVTALLEEPSGILWVGTAGGGLNRLEWPAGDSEATRTSIFSHGAPRITILSTTNGLSDNYIRALHQDAEGVLWAGTDRGLNRCDQGRVTVFTQHHGLPENQVNEILEDGVGRFWISGERSLYRVSRGALNEVAVGSNKWVAAVEYDLADGLPSQGLGGSVSHPASCRTRDGRLWFGTDQGVAVFDPQDLPDLANPPLVVIEQVRANGQILYDNGPSGTNLVMGYPSAGSLMLPPGSGHILEIQYSANTFVGAEKTRFKYRLDGLAREWTDVGGVRKAYFANLHPGAYRFEVLAANKHGVWSTSGASFSFVLEPFFYQRAWFFSACGGVVVLAAYVGVAWRLRESRRFEQLQRQVALDDQRKRIARDIHDELGASLTQIAQLSEDTLAQETPARSHIHRIAALAEEAVNNIGEIVWANNPRYDTLEDLVAFLREYAAEYLGATGIESQLDLPENVPSLFVPGPFRRHLLAIVKESLHNIVKHSAAKKVAVTLSVHDQWLELSVGDNGCGMQFSPALRSGNGFVNIKERLAELNGSFSVDARPNHGVTLRYKVPLPPASRMESA